MRQFFSSIRFKIALGIFLAFVLITSLLNYFLHQSIENNLLSVFNNGVKNETEGILAGLTQDAQAIPITKDDQPFQLWYFNNSNLELIYERSDFPSEYSQFLADLMRETSELNAAEPIVLNMESQAIGIGQNNINQGLNGTLILVLAKSNTSIKKQIHSIRNQIFASSIVAGIISFFIALTLSKSLLKPVKRLIDKAKAVKAGEEMDRLPVSKSNDELTRLSETFNDMIQRIESAIRDQNQFFDSAAHELRTPLTNMLAEIELKLSESKADESQLLVSLKEEALRLSHVVQDFLLLSQLKRNNISIHSTKFRIDDLVYDVVEKMSHSLRRNNFEVNLSMASENLRLQTFGDQAKTESILLNLIGNAIKYGNCQKPISVLFTNTSSQVSVVITNYIEASKQGNSGNGLGLWICDQLAQKQGFQFSYETETEIFRAQLSMSFNAHNSLH